VDEVCGTRPDFGFEKRKWPQLAYFLCKVEAAAHATKTHLSRHQFANDLTGVAKDIRSGQT